MLDGLENLISLNLIKNKIVKIEANSFLSLKKLFSLNLNRNFIKNLNKDSFNGLSNLKVLSLNSNEGLDLAYDSFNPCISLTLIDLSRNKIKTLDSRLFNLNESLRVVKLSQNQLRILDFLKNSKNLEILDIRGCENNFDQIFCTNLKLLQISCNLVKKFDLKNLKNIQCLCVEDIIELEKSPFEMLENLDFLCITTQRILKNGLTAENFNGLKDLKYLYLNVSELNQMDEVKETIFTNLFDSELNDSNKNKYNPENNEKFHRITLQNKSLHQVLYSKIMSKVRFNEPSADPNDLIQKLDDKNKEDYGYYLLRSNYKRVKPHSKYTQEGARPQSPNTPYSNLKDEILANIPRHSESVFRQTTRAGQETDPNKRIFIQRCSDTYNEHSIRGQSASQPYCYITKDPHSNLVPPEYTKSKYGSYPTWGPDETGIRTRSHFVGEPAEKFVNIDMYKRPLTNQAGQIIFDYGRPNNGYYLQRHQYDNTWFNSSLKLNQTDILKSIRPKTKSEYRSLNDLDKKMVRSKTAEWPFRTEYTGRYAIQETNLEKL
ncbi:unnamed protein product [Brachionus calyciflorus]|uniref:Uncharacterized protein n=1 Tax=Brachionus calyciflorus TaxID=104777 RepID=A0A813M528_9BILA|nr:unnamed protein product [Brachionus calyciflorus]